MYGLVNGKNHLLELVMDVDHEVLCRYSADFDADSYSFQGLFGYKVFVAMGLIFGDGLYSLLKIMYSVVQRYRMMRSLKQQLQDEPDMTEAEYAEGELAKTPLYVISERSAQSFTTTCPCKSASLLWVARRWLLCCALFIGTPPPSLSLLCPKLSDPLPPSV